ECKHERQSDRVPELTVVDDQRVRRIRAALPGLDALEAEEEHRNQREGEEGQADDQPDHRRRCDPAPIHRIHLAERRWSGTYRSIIPASTTNIPKASASAKCGSKRTFPL